MASKGISLHIGLNFVDPKAYEGWDGKLNACEADAKDMRRLADSQGYASSILLTAKASRKAVLGGIADAAKKLSSGDIFLLTYSGHGGQIPDLNGDEPDGLDETWVLYDGELVDDELYAAWGQFKSGVRIVVLSDSCHSGTAIKAVEWTGNARRAQWAFKVMPPEVALRTYEAHRKFYDPILRKRSLARAEAGIKASVLLISGCQDNQLSADGAFNGLFTGTLKMVWAGGTFKGNYRQFHKTIVQNMPMDQTPKLFTTGVANPAFVNGKPFKI